MSNEQLTAIRPKAPRGMPGASLVRESEHRTDRGAKLSIREWWNRRRGQNAYRVIQATRESGTVVAEYTARRPGNAAMVFDLYSNGIFDTSMPLADLPPLLSRELGRAWLKAEDGRCGRQHIVGATQDCPHAAPDGFIPLMEPSIHAGSRALIPRSRPTPLSPPRVAPQGRRANGHRDLYDQLHAAGDRSYSRCDACACGGSR